MLICERCNMSKDLYISSLLDVYGQFLSDKQRKITEYYYNDDLSLSEIAENEGITRQGVSDLIRRTESQLKSFEENCRYCESFLRLKELSAGIELENPKIKEIVKIIDEL